MTLRPPVAGTSPLYILERFDCGVVHIDRDLCVVAMNDFARRVLPVDEVRPFDKMVEQFHPERSRAKVRLLFGQAECPVNSAPPMAMIINIPERVLLIKVSHMRDGAGEPAGYSLVFHDITDLVSLQEDEGREEGQRRQLLKIPAVSRNRIALVETEKVIHLRAEGHYTWIQTAETQLFCNLAINELESRLPADRFLRVHRSYIANLDYATEIVREDGNLMLRLEGLEGAIPVSRSRAAPLMELLGLSEVR